MQFEVQTPSFLLQVLNQCAKTIEIFFRNKQIKWEIYIFIYRHTYRILKRTCEYIYYGKKLCIFPVNWICFHYNIALLFDITSICDSIFMHIWFRKICKYSIVFWITISFLWQIRRRQNINTLLLLLLLLLLLSSCLCYSVNIWCPIATDKNYLFWNDLSNSSVTETSGVCGINLEARLLTAHIVKFVKLNITF